MSAPEALPFARIRSAVVAAVALAALSTFVAVPATHAASPFPPGVTGVTRWAILLCSFADTTSNPPDMQPPPSFFADLFTEKGVGKGGMFDYWKAMSYGQLDLTGSQVFGWYVQPQTLAQHRMLGGANPGGRHDKMQACITTASGDASFVSQAPNFFGVVAIWNDGEDTWGGGPDTYQVGSQSLTYGTAAFNPYGWDPAIVAQEMGHGYSLGHSRATSPDPTVDYMDPWDPMSAWTYGNDPSTGTFQPSPTTSNPYWSLPHASGATSGASGPSLNAGYRDMLGWLAPSQIATIAKGGPTTVVKIADVDHAGLGLPVMIKIPRGPSVWDTVELRIKSGWDTGIQHDAVLVHEVWPDARTHIVSTAAPDRALVAGMTFQDAANNIQVYVDSIDYINFSATVVVGGIPPTSTAIVTSTASANGWTNAAQVALSATPAAGGAPVSSIHYTSQPGSAQAVSGQLGAAGGTITISADGSTTLSYYAVDASGMYEYPAHSVVLNVDALPPRTTIATTPVAGGVSVGLSAADARSGVAQIQHQVITPTSTGPVVTDVGASAGFVVAANGVTDIVYWSTDNVGNVEPQQFFRLQPLLAVSPTGVKFGSQVIGTVSNLVTLNLTNTGNMPLTISSLATSAEFGPGTPLSRIACPSTKIFTLAPNVTCTIGVRFAPVGPAGPGQRSGALTITHNGNNGTSRPGLTSIPLTGMGIGVPHATVTPASVAFSRTRVGQTQEQLVTLTNDGWDTLAVSSVGFSGDFSQGITLPLAPAVACPSAPMVLGAGQSCTIAVAFRPSAVGVLSGQLTVVSNSSNVAGTQTAVPLSGTGVTPQLDASPTAVNFGLVLPSPMLPVQVVTLTSSGSMAVHVLGWTITGVDAAAFRVLSPVTCTPGSTQLLPGGALDVGTVCTMNVTFRPTHSGASAATLQINDDSDQHVHLVSLAASAP